MVPGLQGPPHTEMSLEHFPKSLNVCQSFIFPAPSVFTQQQSLFNTDVLTVHCFIQLEFGIESRVTVEIWTTCALPGLVFRLNLNATQRHIRVQDFLSSCTCFGLKGDTFLFSIRARSPLLFLPTAPTQPSTPVSPAWIRRAHVFKHRATQLLRLIAFLIYE